MRNFSSPFIFILLLGIAAISLLRAQLPQGISGKKISYAFQDQGKLKAIFTGQNAKQVTGSQVLVSEFAMKTFRNGDTNQVDLIVEAPECLVDPGTSVASSPGRLQAYTATTNFHIQGEGFFCQQSNAFLIISNKVETTIRKDLLKSRSAGKASQPIAPGLSDSTNQFLKIYADHFEFLYESNLVIYTGKVLVTDPQIGLTCDLLTISLATNKSIQKITAANHVVIVNKRDGSIATGEQAAYTINPDAESIELTGHPTWRDGQHDGKADRFVFDRRSNIFRAERNALFKLPRENIGQPALLGSSTMTNAQNGKLVEISADLVTFKLPETNGPVREIVAEKNVIISSESDQSRATGGKAVYNEATGLVELTGNPVWKNNQNEIKADVLAIGKTNQFFSAKKNVSMKLPATLFKKTLSAGATNAPTATNQFVEIFCNDFSYATNVARFSENVRASLIDESGAQTTLQCDFAKVSFGPGNQVETVLAEKNVVLQEVPGAALRTNLLKKTITCGSLILNRSVKTGLLESIHAESKVVGEQIERAALGEIVKRISAEVMDAKFSTATNQIETVVAERNVLAEKFNRGGGTNETVQASGEKAVYSAKRETVELTGHPSARTETMLFSDALVMLWNTKTGKISAMPYKVTPLNSKNGGKSLPGITRP